MSIEAMKRIKSLLQDTKMIDSHTISAVVAECDMAILAKQPATPEPVAWMASYVDPIGNDRVYVTSHHDLAVENDMHGTPTPLYTHPAPGVPEFSRIAKRKLDELQEQGFAITGYAIQRGPVRGFIDGGGFVGWWQGEPDPGVPDDVVRDAERYRWLRKSLPAGQGSLTVLLDDRCNGAFHKAVFMESLDASIDAAMLAAQAQKGGE